MPSLSLSFRAKGGKTIGGETVEADIEKRLRGSQKGDMLLQELGVVRHGGGGGGGQWEMPLVREEDLGQ